MADSTDTVKNERGMNRIWSKVHPRQVIWFLLIAIVLMMGYQGRGYIDRLEAVEHHSQKQNGILERMKIEQAVQQTNIEWIVEAMGGKPLKPPPLDPNH